MDPKEWAELISGKLLEYDRGRLSENKSELILNHAKLTGNHTGFLFGGRFISNLPPVQHRNVVKSMLHPLLHDDARLYLDDVKLADREEMQIRQGVYSLLQHCNDFQDARDALPDAIVNLFQALSMFKRTRPEAYPIAHSEIKMHNWKIISDVIFTRFASALIN